MAHDVFISHSSKDKAVADAICANLEVAGVRCWIAPRDIALGEDWPRAIANAISQSPIMVLIFSANANSSNQISRELGVAADGNVIIIPFKIDDAKPEPGKQYYLARTHWLDAMNPPTQNQINVLVERVKSILSASGKDETTQAEPDRGRWRRQAEEAKRQDDYETEERGSEEAIRANFEQARWRESGQPLAGVSQDAADPIRVLIVDDIADTRSHLRKLLGSQADIRVIGEAPDGIQAIAQFEALMPDVMTTCIHMPELDGISATEAIRRKHPTAKVIIISVQNDVNYVRRAAMAGACDYLVKPPMTDELLSAIRLAAGRATPQP